MMQDKRGITSILLVLLLFSACRKSDDAVAPPDNNGDSNQAYVSSPKSIVFHSGRNRALLTWFNDDTNVARVKIYWNNQQDSVEKEIPAGTDSIGVYVNDLEEGDYTFNIFALDKNNTRSSKVLLHGHVYGEISGGPERKIDNVTYLDTPSLAIDWQDFDGGDASGTQVVYTDNQGATQHVFIPREEKKSVLKDIYAANRGVIKYRTVFAPQKLIIDTLFTAFTTVAYINRKAVFDSLPGWKFRCKVMAESRTISDFGGMLAFKKKMDEAMEKASKKFQVSGLNIAGNHEIHFYMTSINSFEGTSGQFRYIRGVDDPTLDIMLIVNSHAAADDLSWGWLGDPYLTLGHDYEGLFVPNAIDALTHEFGHSRGMYDLYLEEVTKASDNPISGQTYKAKRGIMNYPYGESDWSALTQFIINESAGQKVAVKYWNYFPESFQIEVKQPDGTPAQGAKISLYPVGYGTAANTVRENDVVMYRGTTNASGSYDFGGNNPFAVNQVKSNVIYNFLVRITYNNNTAYSWMPVDEALLAGSKGLPYTLTVKMP